jgi:hypothetical protein
MKWRGAAVTLKSQAKEQLELYQRYACIARQVTDSQIRMAYEGLAQRALRHAAKLDPAAVAAANASAITVAKPSASKGTRTSALD